MFVLIYVGLDSHDVYYLASLCKLRGFSFTKNPRRALRFCSFDDANFNCKVIHDETLLPLSIINVSCLAGV